MIGRFAYMYRTLFFFSGVRKLYFSILVRESSLARVIFSETTGGKSESTPACMHKVDSLRTECGKLALLLRARTIVQTFNKNTRSKMI